jgi:hypothetical protein
MNKKLAISVIQSDVPRKMQEMLRMGHLQGYESNIITQVFQRYLIGQLDKNGQNTPNNRESGKILPTILLFKKCLEIKKANKLNPTKKCKTMWHRDRPKFLIWCANQTFI